jgi:hypothetical protein
MNESTESTESTESAMLDAVDYYACRDFILLLVSDSSAHIPTTKDSESAYRLASLLDAKLDAIGKSVDRELFGSALVAILQTRTQRPLELAVAAFALGQLDAMTP